MGSYLLNSCMRLDALEVQDPTAGNGTDLRRSRYRPGHGAVVESAKLSRATADG
jgi:hypothetical protein